MKEKRYLGMEEKIGTTVFYTGSTGIFDLYRRTDHSIIFIVSLFIDRLGWYVCEHEIYRIEKLCRSVP